jgi:hypothetical protein
MDPEGSLPFSQEPATGSCPHPEESSPNPDTLFHYFKTKRPDDRCSKHLWNVGKILPDYTVQYTNRQSS